MPRPRVAWSAHGAGLGLVVLALLALEPGRARAEVFLDAYTGINFTQDADLKVKQNSVGNDFTVHDLSYGSRWTEGAPYWGVRAGYFFGEDPAWFGLAVEFFHFKVVGETADTRDITGTHAGQPINVRAPVNTVVQRFESSNGVSYLTLDLIARWGLLVEDYYDEYPHGRLQLYVGVGAGPVFTYARSTIDGASKTAGYEVAGPGVQGFAGVRFLLFKYVGLFAEGKFTHSDLTMSVAKGGHADLTEQSFHVVGGLSIVLP